MGTAGRREGVAQPCRATKKMVRTTVMIPDFFIIRPPFARAVAVGSSEPYAELCRFTALPLGALEKEYHL
jgi:hypothetical protein